MYLTYDEYKEYGGALSETEFKVAELKARKRIDRLTDSRVSKMAEIPEAVKLCAYAVISVESVTGRETQATSPVVTSFNNDGYSESYGNVQSVEDADRSISKLICDYLYGEKDDYDIPLLYRGVRRC